MTSVAITSSTRAVPRKNEIKCQGTNSIARQSSTTMPLFEHREWGPIMSSIRSVAVALSLPLLFASSAFAQTPATDPQASARPYHLPEQPLAAALRAVSVASGISIAAPGELVRGRTARPLVGSFSARDAVNVLLAGSGLSARAVGDSLIIEPAANGAGRSPNSETSDIVVTGSRIRGGRLASPIITETQKDIRRSGQASLGEAVRNIPQSFGGGQNPAVGFNVPTSAGFNLGGGSSINLRGLGSDATLTLLNGHRLSYSASRQSIDVSAIPLDAVERIEIVPDGASAIYGSDAIAGVANLILRKPFTGLEASVRFGAATDGGDVEQRYGLTGGYRWSTGGFVASGEVARSTAIYGRDRSYAASVAPGLTILPPLNTENLLVSATQALNDTLSFDVEVLLNHRRSFSSSANNIAGDFQLSGTRYDYATRSLVIAPTLRWSPGSDWRLFVTGSYGRDQSHFTTTILSAGVASVSGRNCYCNSALSAELGGDGTLFALPGGPVKLAVGVGYRLNRFQKFFGVGNPQTVGHNQDSRYAYGELSVPLVGPEQHSPLIRSLAATGALRYELYPGIGQVVTPKLGLIFAPSENVDFKGSWGKSFRAPTLLQQYQARSIVLIDPSIFGGTGYPPGSVAYYVEGGNAALKPERATTWSATAELHPRLLPGAKLAIGYFNVAYRDRVVTPIEFISQALSNFIYIDRITLAPDAATLAALTAGVTDIGNYTGGPYEPSKVAVLIDNRNVNAGRQSAKGIDLLATYQMQFAGARTLTATLDTSYLTSSRQISGAQPTLALAGNIFNPPHWRARGGLDWDARRWGLTAYANYTGGVADVRSSNSPHIGSVTSIDLAAHVAAGDHDPLSGSELTVSVQNLFNAKPHQIRTSFPGDAPFDSTNYSPVGRFVAVRLSKSW